MLSWRSLAKSELTLLGTDVLVVFANQMRSRQPARPASLGAMRAAMLSVPELRHRGTQVQAAFRNECLHPPRASPYLRRKTAAHCWQCMSLSDTFGNHNDRARKLKMASCTATQVLLVAHNGNGAAMSNATPRALSRQVQQTQASKLCSTRRSTHVSSQQHESTDSDPASASDDDQQHQQQAQDSTGVRIALSVLRFYKREISPIIPPSCRFVPTCSEYSMEAFQEQGVARGAVLTAWRLLRCNPFGAMAPRLQAWPAVTCSWPVVSRASGSHEQCCSN